MILGNDLLKVMFKGLDDDQYQPNSVDLKLKEVLEIDNSDNNIGLYNNYKILPDYIKVNSDTLIDFDNIDNSIETFTLKPHTSYILVIDGVMNIPENVAQFYLPRSSLLRCGLSLHTALGDSGFNGVLRFLVTNNTDNEVRLGKGERVATAVNIRVIGATKYNGDYNEE